MMMESKRMKVEEIEDRISRLPDQIIHHILSFLPSTKEAIHTSLLSKRWKKQWTHVPVLIFRFSDFTSDDISRVSRFIDNTLILHNSSKIKKFHVESNWYNFANDPNSDVKLQFAINKDAEELILNFDCLDRYKLPTFFFNYASLVKLRLNDCILMPIGKKVNWESLKNLCLESCWFPDQAIESVVTGSPLLELLEINYCRGFDRLAIASKSLKKLDLIDLQEKFVLEISCPKLEEFCVSSSLTKLPVSCLYDGTLESVLSGSPLLELLQVRFCEGLKQLNIDSKSLKKLVLVDIEIDEIVISCPILEELLMRSLCVDTIELTNLPSSLRATLDFNCYEVQYGESLVKMIFEKLHHVKDLTIGAYFIKVLSTLEIRGVSPPLINRKLLTFECGPNFVEYLPGIAYALRSSPGLEKLVITLLHSEGETRTPEDFLGLNVSAENYWNSKGIVYNSLVFHLKIVEIVGLSKEDDKLNLMLNFVEFLLKNARALEKMVIILEDREVDFVLKVSQKLLFSRFSQHTIVELLCPESPRIS